MATASKTSVNTASGDHPWLATYPDGVKWDADLTPKPVYKILEDTVEKFPDNNAVDFLDKKFTYAEIGTMVNKLAMGLQKLGVKKGTKVGVFLPNSPFFVVAYYAISRAGGTIVNFNPLYSERELAHQIEDSDTEIMITLDLKMLYDKMSNMLRDTTLNKLVVCPFTKILPFPKNLLFPVVKAKERAKVKFSQNVLAWSDVIQNPGTPDTVDINPEEDIALLQYTGGTTGVPKGAMLTHANLYINTMQASMWFTGVEPGKDKMLGVLPFFHVFAMTVVMNLSIYNGMEIIALPRFELEQALKAINDKKPTNFPAVPAIYNAIINHKDVGNYDLSSIKFCLSGGAPLPADTKEQFEKLTGCSLVEGYGLTESSPVATCNPVVGENRTGSIGLPLPQTVIEIVSTEDGETVMPLGERGEICISGPQVMKGYYNKPEETEKTMRDGMLHTGDVAFIDKDGYVHIVDRIKDMILTNGYNVYPRNIEEVIYMHPAVEECIVAGIPDKQRGEKVKAWIKRKEGADLTEEEIKGFMKDKLSPIEMPREIEFRTEPLPKTMIGKLSRKDILEEEKAKKSAA